MIYIEINNIPSIWDYLGYNLENNTFNNNSILARGTNEDIRKFVYDYLVNIYIKDMISKKYEISNWKYAFNLLANRKAIKILMSSNEKIS